MQTPRINRKDKIKMQNTKYNKKNSSQSYEVTPPRPPRPPPPRPIPPAHEHKPSFRKDGE
jgi:hypothetical protein